MSEDMRECANCGDEAQTLSSRDWCDGCEEDPDGLVATYGTPCGHCGAVVGEPCYPDCPAAAAAAQEPETVTPARQLYRVLYTLPFAGVLREVPEPGADVDGWLVELAGWLLDYGEWSRAEVERLGAVERKAIGMQIRQDVLGGFLRDLLRESD